MCVCVEAVDLINSILEWDPLIRPSTGHVLRHAWLQNVKLTQQVFDVFLSFYNEVGCQLAERNSIL